ncbi:uncharacterized protein P884DRAFT_320393, partial [Thermothelomyces heterothallicus CBS 202.75]|uniref:uncharacterized protein n=1 Tax=Thermothelomyces heterothallicus CBS 202.75 TaxID=1149848 RepID=UPI0037422FCF
LIEKEQLDRLDQLLHSSPHIGCVYPKMNDHLIGILCTAAATDIAADRTRKRRTSCPITMSRPAHPFPPPPNAPFLWARPVCDCHYYYQYYLCGCPDRYVATAGGRLKHIPSRQGCAFWYKPFIERLVQHNAGFRHNPNPPTRPDPSVLPFPCYRHLMESRIFLSPDELRAWRRRLSDPRWNPVSAARLNHNMSQLQKFQKESRLSQKQRGARKRARAGEEDDRLILPLPRKRKVLPPKSKESRALLMLSRALITQHRELDLYKLPPGDMRAYACQQRAHKGDRKSPRDPEPSVQGIIRDTNLQAAELYRRYFNTFHGATHEELSDAWRKLHNLQRILSCDPHSSLPLSPVTLAQELETREAGQAKEAETEAHSPTTRGCSPMQALRLLPQLDPEPEPGRRIPHDHFNSLTWLLEEHSVDLWRQDGCYSRCPRPLPPDVRYDGPTHTGYFAGAYRTDPEVLHQARVASWGREFGELGVWWARRVKELWAEFVEGSSHDAGGGGVGAGFWMGGKLNM